MAQEMTSSPAGRPPVDNCEQRQEYLKLADRLLGQFRPTPGVDPALFMTAIATILQEYPLWVAQEICDPVRGLPGRQNWMPSPYDVRKLAEALMRPQREQRAWEARSAAQAASREVDRSGPRQSIEEIEDEMATRGIYMAGWLARHTRAPMPRSEFLKKYNMPDFVYDLIPDQKGPS